MDIDRYLSRKQKRLAQIVIDGAIAGAAFIATYLIRYDAEIPPQYLYQMLLLLPFVIVGKTALTYLLGSYRQFWKYISIKEAYTLVLAAFACAAALLMVRLLGIVMIPFSVIIIDAFLFGGGVIGVRIVRRLQVDSMKKQGLAREPQRTLFLGAGDAAHALLKDENIAQEAGWNVVGLLDDDADKQGFKIDGKQVIGYTTDMERVIEALAVDHVVIAMPSADAAIIRDLLHRAQRAGVTVQAAPSLQKYITGGLGGAPSYPPITLNDLMDAREVRRTLISRISADAKDRTLLITGGAGYIGTHLVEMLLENGYRVRVLDNLTFGDSPISEFYAHPEFDLVKGDISSVRDVVGVVKDAGTVIALAAIVGDPACDLNAEETLNLNYESTKVLAEACNFYGVNRLVFASSCSVYGAGTGNVLTEESELNPVSLYARTRIMSENVLLERCTDVVPVVLRLSTVFGLSRRMRFDLVVNALTVRAVVDGKIQIFGGSQWRPFVHCRDAARAFYLAATAPERSVNRQVFNVGSEEMNYTISQIGEIVAREVGGVEIENTSAVEDLRNYRVSFARIHRRLGFSASHTIEDGIREIAGAVKADPRLHDYSDPVFSNLELMRDRYESAGIMV